MAIVYQHRRNDTNEIFYVGIGKALKRAYSKQTRSKPWKDLIKNHPYTVEILFENLTWESACEEERRLIGLYGRRDLGLGTLVNMTSGGDGVENLPQETLKLIGSKLKGRLGTFTGKKHTDEAKEKNRIAHLGKKHSEEVNRKKIRRGDKNGKSIAIFDPTTGLSFPTMTAAAQHFKVCGETIRTRVKKHLLISKTKV